MISSKHAGSRASLVGAALSGLSTIVCGQLKDRPILDNSDQTAMTARRDADFTLGGLAGLTLGLGAGGFAARVVENERREKNADE